MPIPDKNPCFASDNCSGMCPAAMEALIKANEGYALSYGEDCWTRQTCDLFRETFETPCEVFFIFNGTAGNSLALAALCRSYHSVLGGSKNGLGIGEALVFFNAALADEFAYRCKQAGQLASKMRMIAAPWVGILKNGEWLRSARHANECADLLARKLGEIPEVAIALPRQANSVFVKMSPAVAERLKRKGWHFYMFMGAGAARLMCSWSTTHETIEALIADLKASVNER